MNQERWYFSVIFLGISVLAHFGLLAATFGRRPTASLPEPIEIEVGLKQERPLARAASAQTDLGRPRRGARQRPVRMATTAKPDPFAPAPAGVRLRETAPRTVGGAARKDPTSRLPRRAAPGPEAQGEVRIPAASDDTGTETGNGVPRSRVMGVRAAETPAPRMTFISSGRGYTASERRPGTPGPADDGSAGGRATARFGPGGQGVGSSGVNGQPEGTHADVGSARAGAASEVIDSGPGTYTGGAKPRQEAFVPARRNYQTSPPIGYPDAAFMQRQQGAVTIRVQVGADGRLESSELVQSSGFPLLDERALATIRASNYEPARNLNGPIESWLTLQIRFALHL